MINCPDCAKEMSNVALACPNCGRPNAIVAPAKRPVSILLGIGILFIPIIFSWFTLRNGHSVLSRVVSFSWLLLSLALVNAGNGIGTNTPSITNTPTQKAQTEQVKETLTGPQKNAVRSAKQYLSLQGFSRDGLVQQLSADVGDGYAVADATVAVDSLNIDWSKEAVKSAKQYLTMQGFSCQGLIEQLSSSAGDKYTVSQATYGAQQAGACQ